MENIEVDIPKKRGRPRKVIEVKEEEIIIKNKVGRPRTRPILVKKANGRPLGNKSDNYEKKYVWEVDYKGTKCDYIDIDSIAKGLNMTNKTIRSIIYKEKKKNIGIIITKKFNQGA